MLEKILYYERDLFFLLNGSDCVALDRVIWLCTGKAVWLPLAAVILGVLIYKRNLREWLPALTAAVLTVAVCDQFSSSLIKPAFERLRPTYHPDFMESVKTVYGYRGGHFGFISSHAANTFGFAMFMSLFFRNTLFSWTIFLWAAFTAYTRVYLGVHFISDIIAGALAGAFFGAFIYVVYSYFNGRRICRSNAAAGNFACAPYSDKRMRLIAAVIIITLVCVFVFNAPLAAFLR